MSAADVFTKEYLEEHYVRLNKTLKQIAFERGYSSTSIIHRYLDIHAIPRRNGKPSKVLTKELLVELYVEKQLSTKVIAKRLGLRSHTSVRSALKEFDIPLRHRGWKSPAREAAMIRNRKGYKDICGSYWCCIKTAARKRDLEFSISLEYAWNVWESQGGKCALSGAPINLVAVRQRMLDGLEEQTASLDRIDSTRGYVEGNVQWVHKAVQRIKWDMPDDDFIRWCVMVVKKRGDVC